MQQAVLQLQLSACSATCKRHQQVWPHQFPCCLFLHVILSSWGGDNCCSMFLAAFVRCNAVAAICCQCNGAHACWGLP